MSELLLCDRNDKCVRYTRRGYDRLYQALKEIDSGDHKKKNTEYLFWKMIFIKIKKMLKPEEAATKRSNTD